MQATEPFINVSFCFFYTQYTDYPKHDHNLIAELLKQWKIHKSENILTYREHCHKSPVTGTVGVPLYAPWVDAMDDTLEGFVGK